jgi:hypothetical protein
LAYAVTLLTFTPEVPGSNLDQDTGFPDFFHGLQSLQTNAWIVLRSGHGRFLPNPFST